MKALILDHQQGLQIGDEVDVEPSVLRVRGIFVIGPDGKSRYLRSGYLVLDEQLDAAVVRLFPDRTPKTPFRT